MDMEKMNRIAQEAAAVNSCAAHGLITDKESKHLKKVLTKKLRGYLKPDMDEDVEDVEDISVTTGKTPLLDNS